jgi:membrane associated rhomboid family serine protease
MGIYDREYVRVGPRSSSGLGNLRVISFNTWLIIINCAVFLLGGLLSGVPWAVRPVYLAPQFEPGVSPEQAARAVRIEGLFDPKVRGVQALPLFDPQTPARDAGGRVIVDQQGQAMPARVGVQPAMAQPFLDAWGHFSTQKAFRDLEVWRFVTFQFLHANLMHLVFNMMGLWFVGGLVEQYLGSKRYAAFYLTCGIFGALLYLILNLVGNLSHGRLPGVLFDDPRTPLVGASAGIFGVLMAAAFIAPNAIVQIMGVVPMKMRTAVYTFTGLALLNLLWGGNNQGGDAAHMGGAIAGYYFIRHTHLLRDFFDIFGDSRSAKARGGAGEGGRRGLWARLFGPPAAPDPAEVNRILDKLHAGGLQSLTDGEKATLRRASQAGQDRPSGR